MNYCTAAPIQPHIVELILFCFRWHPWKCFRSSSTQALCPEMQPLSSLPSMCVCSKKYCKARTLLIWFVNNFLLHTPLCFCQVWLRCLWHPGEVPRPVPGQPGHWGGIQGQTQHQDPTVGGLPNQGPQPQNPFLLSWWTAGDPQQIW